MSDEDLIKRLKQRLTYCIEIEDISKRLTEMIGARVGSASLPQLSTVTLQAICCTPMPPSTLAKTSPMSATTKTQRYRAGHC